MIKPLGLADIFAGILLLAKAFGITLPLGAVVFFAIYLVGKGLFFVVLSFDVGSMVDVLAGLLLGSTIFFEPSQTILGIAAFFLLIKGFASIFS